MPMKRQRGGDTPPNDPGTEPPALVWSSHAHLRVPEAVDPDEARKHNTQAVSLLRPEMQQAQSPPHLAVPLVKRQQVAPAADTPAAATAAATAALAMPRLATIQGGSDVDQQVQLGGSAAAMCLEDLLQPGDAYVQPVHSSAKDTQQQPQEQQRQEQSHQQHTMPHEVAATSQAHQLPLADDGVWGSEEEEEDGTWQAPHMQLPAAHWDPPAHLAAPLEGLTGPGSAGQVTQAATSASSSLGHMQARGAAAGYPLTAGGSVEGLMGSQIATSSSRGAGAGAAAAGWLPWEFEMPQQAAAAAAAGAVPGAAMTYGSSTAAQPLTMNRFNPQQQQPQQQQQQLQHWRAPAGWQLPPGTLRLPWQPHQQQQQQRPQPLPLPQQPPPPPLVAAPPQQPQQQTPWRSRRGNARQRRQRDRAAGQQQQQVAAAQSMSPAAAGTAVGAGVTWSPAPHGPGSAAGAASAPQPGAGAAAGRGGLVNLGAIFGSPGSQHLSDAGDAGVRTRLPVAAGQQIQQLLAGIAALQQAPPGGRAQQGRRARRELAFRVSGAGQQVQARREAAAEQDV